MNVDKMREEYPLFHPRSVSLEIAMDVHALCDEVERLRRQQETLLGHHNAMCSGYRDEHCAEVKEIECST